MLWVDFRLLGEVWELGLMGYEGLGSFVCGAGNGFDNLFKNAFVFKDGVWDMQGLETLVVRVMIPFEV